MIRKVSFILFLLCRIVTLTAQAKQPAKITNRYTPQPTNASAWIQPVYNDSIYCAPVWDTTLNAWKKLGRYILTFNGTGKPTLELRQNWDNGSWQNAAKDSFGYDIDFNLTYVLVQQFDQNTTTWNDAQTSAIHTVMAC